MQGFGTNIQNIFGNDLEHMRLPEFTGALHQAPRGVGCCGVGCTLVMWGGVGVVVGGMRWGAVGCGGVG